MVHGEETLVRDRGALLTEMLSPDHIEPEVTGVE